MAQLSQAQAVPDGWKLVPKEATQLMIDAMPPVEEVGYWAMYEAAIAASPTPPARKGLSDEQIKSIYFSCPDSAGTVEGFLKHARAIEAAHGIQGEGNA